MENGTKKTSAQPSPEQFLEQVGRRRFLRYAGFSVAMTSAILAACENNEATLSPNSQRGARVMADGSIDLGAGDIGVLNYAFVLEQLETAFYELVIQNPYVGITNREFELLKEVRNHEIIHREFFKAALGAAGVPMLTFDFTGAADLKDRLSVLNTARQFEDIGVSAYNGGGRLLSDPQNLVLAGKIVSVEARHTALLRTLTASPGSGFFAGDDVIDGNGLDVVRTPQQVLPIAQRYIKERITANNLPMM